MPILIRYVRYLKVYINHQICYNIRNIKRLLWKKINRNWNFDLYRCIAVLLLVLLHLLVEYPFRESFFLLYFYKLSSSVISMFVLISGYFLFQQKEFSKSNIIKRILKLVVPLLYYFTIYFTTMHLAGVNLDPSWDITKYPQGGGHLWYLYTILPISIMSSFISLPILDSKKKALLYSGLTMSLLLLLISVNRDPFNFNFNRNSMFGDHSGFLLIAFVGYGLGNKYISLNSKWSVFVVFCLWQLSIFALVLFNNEDAFGFYGLSSIICLFLLVKAVPEQKVPILIKKSVSFIAKYSLPIYGWHRLFNDHFVDIIIEYIPYKYFNIPIAFFSVLGLSLACSIITSKMFSILFKREIVI